MYIYPRLKLYGEPLLYRSCHLPRILYHTSCQSSEIFFYFCIYSSTSHCIRAVALRVLTVVDLVHALCVSIIRLPYPWCSHPSSLSIMLLSKPFLYSPTINLTLYSINYSLSSLISFLIHQPRMPVLHSLFISI